MLRTIPLLLILACSALQAGVYKWVGEDGSVNYSDEPQPGAKAITLPEISVYPFDMPEWKSTPKATPAAAVPEVSKSQARVGYRSFSIAQPANDYWVGGDRASLPVRMELEPGLQQDDRIRLYLDGELYLDELTELQAEVSGFPPGSHILEARVVDAAGSQRVRTKSVLFHFQPDSP